MESPDRLRIISRQHEGGINFWGTTDFVCAPSGAQNVAGRSPST